MKTNIKFKILLLLFTFQFSLLKADWIQVNNGLTNLIVGPLCSYSSGGVNYIFAGTSTNNPGGIYLSTNNGDNWSLIYTPINEGDIYKFAITNSSGVNYLYAGTLGYIFRSTNNGASWDQLPFPNGTHWYYSIAASSNYVFTGLKWWSNDSGGVYKSTNYGINWVRTSIPIQQYQDVDGLFINGNYVYAGGYIGTWVSTDNGTNWLQTSSILGPSVFVINGNYLFAGDNGVWYSTNSGFNWIQTSLNYGSINSLLVYNNTIFAGGGGVGVAISSNNGITWVLKDEGLNNYLDDICISNNYIFAGTQGGGVYRRPMSELVGINSISHQIPLIYKLYQNYPNPFNPNTKIKYDVPKSAHINIKVYDLLGKEVLILVNEFKQSGTYETEFKGSNFSSGVYFYQLIADNKIIDTKKLILNK